MTKLIGDTTGLKPSLIRRLENLYRRRLSPAELILPEQARDLAALAGETGRQVGILISRRGEVAQVLVGGPEALPAPDASRLRRGSGRLAGHHLLRTDFTSAEPIPPDHALLLRLRLDYLAVLAVEPDGRPGEIGIIHLLPRPEEGQDVKALPPFPPGRPPEDLARLVRALEEELAALGSAARVEGREAAILVSVSTAPRAEAEQSLAELGELAATAGLAVAGRVIQRLARPNPRTLLGPGKLSEVLLLALRRGARLLVFDQELTPGQARSLATATQGDLKFLDRTQLILDIFAQRAKSREGKLQVEMAQLRYLTPRLASRDDGLSRLTGGIGGRGPGETKLEIDRRRVRERLHRLARELKQVAGQRQRRRQHRERGDLPIISIVGYTNAGKSTLLNALTGSQVLAENRLFATLDPTSRRLRFPREREAIVTDTVGFIQKLPEELRKAFAATLEELTQADLLLHLADASNPRVEEQIQAVEAILDELALEAPRLLVLNKQDRTPPEALAALVRRHGGALAISAQDPTALPPLLALLQARLGDFAWPGGSRPPEAPEDTLDASSPSDPAQPSSR